VQRGFDLVPHCVIDQHFLARQREGRLWRVLAAHPQRLGIGVDEDTAAIIRGQRLSVLGDSTVSLCVAGFRDEPQRVERLKSGDEVDLQPLLRELQQRPAAAR
jgi:cyanophycinase